MERKMNIQQRIQKGMVSNRDVRRMLAELARGRANDCVRLALEKEPCLEKLDLRLLAAVKRSESGSVEVKLLDRLQILRQLAEAAEQDGAEAAEFLRELQPDGGV